MLRSINRLRGHLVDAQDGHIGSVRNFYFDDLTWEVQYVVVDTGKWLEDRRVLVPRAQFGAPDWAGRRFPVSLTKAEVEGCPPMSAHEPVSRQMEAELVRHLGIEAYWTRLPGGVLPIAVSPLVTKMSAADELADPDLRSCDEVHGYHIQGSDGEIGHVADFLVDDESWVVRYLVVDTRNWLPGRRVVVGVGWLSDIDWPDARVHVEMTRAEIEASPRYEPTETVGGDYIEQLMEHYGGVARWMQ